MSQITSPVFSVVRVLASANEGGKLVAVVNEATGNLQAQARASGTPLTVFIAKADVTTVSLQVFTPNKEKGSSDSAALAALSTLQSNLLDIVQVNMGQKKMSQKKMGQEEMSQEELSAQLCGGEWLLKQGTVKVSPLERANLSPISLSPLNLAAKPAFLASLGRPNLVVGVKSLAELESFIANAEAISKLNKSTNTTGLILFALGGVGRADVSFRCFGPLKGFLEDAASSNMFACLVGVLGQLDYLPKDSNLLIGAQRMPKQPARLTAQFTETEEGVEVWVGGSAVRE